MQAVGSDRSSLHLEQARTDQISLRLFFSGIPVQDRNANTFNEKLLRRLPILETQN